MKKIRVGIVHYLNTAPLLFGLRESSLVDEMDLIPGYPAELARMLEQDRIDLGLVPVTLLRTLSGARILGDTCIGCEGQVASVCIFARRPLEECSILLADYQSRTSVQLARILLRDHWKLVLPLRDTGTESFLDAIGDEVAGLVIGDRALARRGLFPYVYDLGQAWKDHTGLPFVFAAWIGNKVLPEEFITRFNAANAEGLRRIGEATKNLDIPGVDMEEYFRKHISYRLDDSKIRGMERFLHTLAGQKQ